MHRSLLRAMSYEFTITTGSGYLGSYLGGFFGGRIAQDMRMKSRRS
jgi:hypothetical protein